MMCQRGSADHHGALLLQRIEDGGRKGVQDMKMRRRGKRKDKPVDEAIEQSRLPL